MRDSNVRTGVRGIVNESDHPAESRGARVRFAHWCHRASLLPLLGRVRDWRGEQLRILAYHRVLDVEGRDEDFPFDLDLVSAGSRAFADQMRFLRNHYQPLRLGDLPELIDKGRGLPRRAVVVTFDDGYDDNYRIAFPILRELGIPATFFVCSGFIESGLPFTYDWLVHMLLTAPVTRVELPEIGYSATVPDEHGSRRALAANVLQRLKDLDAITQEAIIARLARDWNMPRNSPVPLCRPMSWAQLREMRDAGMEIASHGVNHHMLAKLPLAQMRDELVRSRDMLAAGLGTPPTSLAYPVGGASAYSPAVIDAARDAGYRLACTYIHGTNRWPPGNPYRLRRIAVERAVDQPWFAASLAVPEWFSYSSPDWAN